jgi:hypothetical protein
MRRLITLLALAWAVAGGGARAQAQPVQQAGDASVAADPSPATAETGEMTEAQRAQYAGALREYARAVRGQVFDSITAKIEHKQTQKLDRIATLLSIFAFSGVLLLLLPFFLRKKYPDRMGVLVKYSALAALLFFLAVNLFSVVLLVMRGTQTVLGQYTNPQVKLVTATFDLIEKKADEFADVGPLLIEPTLQSLHGESDEPVLAIMLDNVQKLHNDVSVFTSIGTFVRKLDWLYGILPVLFIGLAVFLFARVARPTLTEIARLPERAAQGERGAVGHTVRLTLRNVWAETRATFCIVGVLILMTVMAATLLGFVLEPAIEVFMAYLAVSFLYIQVDAAASSFWILFSLMGSILFLVLNLAVILLTTIFVLLKTQKIFQQHFREGVPLRAHRSFWQWGTLSAVWTQVLPVLYVAVAVKAIGWFVEKSAEKFLNPESPSGMNWPFVLASGPALFLVTFLLIFWIGRGISALQFLAGYKVDGQAYAAFTAAEQALTTAGAHSA